MRAFFSGEGGQWRAFALIWIVTTASMATAVGEIARRDSEAAVTRQAATAGALHAAVLRSELERHRSLPLVLAQDPDLIALVKTSARRIEARLGWRGRS